MKGLYFYIGKGTGNISKIRQEGCIITILVYYNNIQIVKVIVCIIFDIG